MRVGDYGKLRIGQSARPGKSAVPKLSNSTTVVSPIGGINTRDPIANMDAQDAIAMINFWPGTVGCSVRNGYSVHAYGLPGTVETVAEHNLARAPLEAGTTAFMYAFAGGKMFDVSDPGDHSADTPLATGLNSNRWQWVNFGGAAGVSFVAVSGEDNPIWVKPDNTLVRLIAGNGTDPNTISGVDPAKFVHLTVHQRRLWFVEKDSTRCWYLPTEQIFGVAALFDFGALFKRGGYVTAIATWTVDTGDGSDDRLVVLSSNGEVATYVGTNPASADSWSLVGVFYVGAPVGRRCMTRLGGDVAIICEQGLASLSSTLTSTTVNSRDTFFSDKIQSLISGLTDQQFLSFGWEPFVFPRQNMILLNVPNANGNYQLAMNTLTGSWTMFQGLVAWSWTLFMQEAYFGASGGKVMHGMDGFLDGVDTFSSNVGLPIDSYALTAFNYFTAPGLEKQFQLVRPNFIGGKKPDVAVAVAGAFNNAVVPFPAITQQSNVDALWDVAKWDKNLWYGGTRSFSEWYNGDVISYAASLGIRTRTVSDMTWVSVDWVINLQKGNAL